MVKVSVIIPAYNEEQCLPETLERISKALSIAACPSEIIVVDNDSQDGTKQIAEAFGAKVLLEEEHNISRVRNTGAENSIGDILIFIDADTLVPDTLFQKITAVMDDEKCLGGAVAVGYGGFERDWMKFYLMGWAFWGKFFNMAQGAAQFCRKSVFNKLEGYDQTIFMGEDVEFYWRLSKFAKRNEGHLHFIEHPKVTTSTRRFDKMSLMKTFLLTHPILIRLTWRKKSFWKDWYEKAVR
ncbi:MAG: glycosyltransferase [Pyrinomonadaceae bacterium MAG19_C2-C3]|nr:glycosyltransferase [Pyrinomonadaceae bacterium MAG19_C2-C3]